MKPWNDSDEIRIKSSSSLEPVIARSVGRWKHYERHFSGEVLALLTSWIERWGY